MHFAKWFLWLGAAVALVVSLWQLEAERSSVTVQQIDTLAGPVSIYTAQTLPEGPLVIVTHGFAGSRQMMQYISRDLARAGFTVAAFDFLGHGRSKESLSPDITRIEGTTRQLVAQTRAVAKAVRTETGLAGPVALLGHSMATDIIIRAAQEMPKVAAIVAISMYSDAVTARFPERLLVISGEWEGRLRDVGLKVVSQVDEQGVEGETIANGDVIRRAVSVPGTEHVAVLFSGVTMKESRNWLHDAFGGESAGQPHPRGFQILIVLSALVILIWPASRLLPKTAKPAGTLPLKSFFAALALPIVPASVAAVLTQGSLLGFAAFGSLTLFFALWGLTSLWVLWRAGHKFQNPNLIAGLFLLVWALGGFALALNRYGAAFLPVGPRWNLMLLLSIGTLPFALADRLIVAGAQLWQRVVARVVPIAVLAVTMALSPQSMGLSFTVLPVMVLFYGVYGTMGRADASRKGPEAVGLALGIVLAWSIAASTPLFAV